MVEEGLRIDPNRMAGGWPDLPIAFVALDTGPLEMPPLPPYPVVGIGDPGHPSGRRLDAVVEPPVSLAGLAASARANPLAASAAMRLLRRIDAMPVDAAIEQESLAYGALQAGAEHAAWLARREVAPQPPGRLHVTRTGNLLELVLDRPQARNAIDRVMRDALFEAFTVAELDRDIERVTLRAAGPAFSMGGDLAEFGTTRDPDVAHAIRMQTLPAIPLSRRADIYHVHIQGGCVGAGLELAAFAARVTASPRAWFQLPELAMGLIPGAGGCVSVPRRIGRQRAGLMILSGKRINARTALDWGLIDAIEDLPPVDPARADSD
ncbi:enoyl-CoA hydratase/isomerase family protein [Stakelama tenebrarum]|uniref:Enoyl-CoA hydratase/isomerase family protein n=1 Tax=Stakelama tenebrarum TaxID=2711215 RepID=A0A6G6Y726_9SPHN|nr:enoyl-CoA hydratase/isomerase family protein [Sphingosinithalassobacter tenebrarum]QIG80725.1 enoyl-CoA hydratase/isomerase family protein [Sphingosinithalassobacter tenebrarum]